MRIAVLVILAGVFATGTLRAAEDDPRGIDFFEKKIRPVLVANCYQCHSASAKKLKGELAGRYQGGHPQGRRERRGGDCRQAWSESLILKALRHEDGLEMPPNKERLSDELIADFVKWVQIGAADPRKANATTVGSKINIAEARKFWSFQPPKNTSPPAVKNAAWAETDIDRFVLAGLEAKSLAPVADADRRTLVRRVYFDLVGLPPTPGGVEAFVQRHVPKAVENVVDRLLASPHFGERWGRHWLDVARYGESTGNERNIPYPYAWRYRDYVYRRVQRRQALRPLRPRADRRRPAAADARSAEERAADRHRLSERSAPRA